MMLKTINTLQLMLFHYVFAYEVMKERAEEAEKQADAFAGMLAKVVTAAKELEESLEFLAEGKANDEDSGGCKQSPRTPDGGCCRCTGDKAEAR